MRFIHRAIPWAAAALIWAIAVAAAAQGYNYTAGGGTSSPSGWERYHH
jgi:hypothetical protein